MKVISVALRSGNRHHTKVNLQAMKKGLEVIAECSEELIHTPTLNKYVYTRSFLAFIGEPEETIVVVDRLHLFKSPEGYGKNKLPLEMERSGCRLMSYNDFKLYSPSKDLKRRAPKKATNLSELDLKYKSYDRVPFGYTKGKTFNDQGYEVSTFDIDPEEKIGVKLLYKLVEEHRNYSAVGDLMAKNGFPNWTRARIKRLIKSKVYCGFMRVGNQWVEGRHKPIVSLERWRSMQLIVTLKAKSWIK